MDIGWNLAHLQIAAAALFLYVSRIAVAVAVALIAFGLGLFPKEGMKGLAKGLAVTISLVVIAAFLITAARSIGPKEK